MPTILLSFYLFVISADQYESEAHFLVKSPEKSEFMAGGLTQALSMVTGEGSGNNVALSVVDYLASHDVVETLRKEDRLVERFRDPSADMYSRLWSANPKPESLLKFYQKQVSIHYDSETGITSLVVRTFKPQDSFDIARKLLQLGEARVNYLNARSYSDAVSSAQRQLSEAQIKLEAIQRVMTNFRQQRRDIDPEVTGKAQIGLVSTLTGQLAAARAQLSAMGGMIDHASPQYRAIAGRVRALEGQVNAQAGRLTGTGDTIASNIGSYENLQLEQQFLAKQYEAAAANLQKAREEARRQQLYVTRVVEPNLPVKSLYPQRFRVLGTAFVVLMLIYSISWLIVAGVKEHSA